MLVTMLPSAVHVRGDADSGGEDDAVAVDHLMT